MRRWLLMVLLLLSVGCATTEPTYQPPPLPPPPAETAPGPSRIPSGLFVQEELLQLMASDPIPDVTPKQARKAVKTATERSIIRPKGDNMKRAVVIYPYQEGGIYEIYTFFRRPTDLVFSDPEEVIEASKTDDWWDVTIKVVGEEPNRQWHVVITPMGPEHETTMLVLTTKAVYYLHVVSGLETPMMAVRWKHPTLQKPLPKLLNPGIYYTGYDVEVVAGRPEWTPLEIWDTGLGGHTLIKLPPRTNVTEIPALVVLGNDGKPQLTNWQSRRDTENTHPQWYVAPRLFNRAELRVGHTGAEVVRISRGADYRAVWCPAPDAGCPEGVP